MADVDWRSVGVVGAVVLAIIVTGLRRYWMFTWVHDQIVAAKDEAIAQRDADLARERQARQEWQTLALTQAGVLEKTVTTATEVVRKAAAASPPGGAPS